MAAAPRIHPAVPAVIAVVVVGVLVALIAGRGGDDAPDPVASPSTASTTTVETTIPEPTTTTTTLPDPVPVGEVLAPGPAVDEPAAYTITYDIVENELARSETWAVRRPYESLITSVRDGELLSGTATSRGALWTYLSDREAWLRIQPELHRAAFDSRPAAALGTLGVLGFVEELGDDVVAGRPCTVFRTGAPPAGSQPTRPGAAEATELCVDDAGLVLHEIWRIEGRTVVERTATAVDLAPDLSAVLFDPEPEVADADDFAAALQIVAVPADDDTQARLSTSLPDPPEGYALDGTVFRASSASAGGSTSEIVRFFSSGPDLLEVSEQYADRTATLAGGAAVRVAVDGWDEVWLDPGFRTSALRARLTESSYVELRHHDPALLVEVLSRLVRADDGG